MRSTTSNQQGGSRWLPIIVAIMVLAGIGWWAVGDGTGASGDANEVADASKQMTGTGLRAKNLPPALAFDPVASERSSLGGTVSDPKGVPIPGATVCAWTESDDVSSMHARKPACAKTGQNGHYRIEGLLAVRHTVSAGAPEFRPGAYERETERGFKRPTLRLQPGVHAEGVDIVLQPGGVPVTGVVKDISGGEVEGALVRAAKGGRRGWQSRAKKAVAWSGEDGEFELWVDPGEVSVTARGDGYANARRTGVAPGHFFELFLTPESVIVGKVVEAGTGQPVAGAMVGKRGRWSWGNAESTATTAEDGTFRMDGLEPGNYKLQATAAESYGLAPEMVHLGLGQTSDPIVIEVHPAFYLEGRVVMKESQEGCVEGGVRIRDNENDREAWAEADDEGTVVVKALQPGTYEVAPVCQGMLAEDRYEPVVIADASVEGIVWEVRESLAIRGQVVDSTGAPVEDMMVSAQAMGGDDPRARSSNAWGQATEADGSFQLAGLKPGKYRLVTFGDLPEPEERVEVELETSDINDVRLELPAVGTIAGIVRDEKGQPVGGVTVEGQTGVGWGWSASSHTADDGTFELADLKVGDVRVVATQGWDKSLRAPGTSDDDVQGEKVTVLAGKTVNVDLTVESQSETISGRVVDELGAPVVDAFVEVEREKESAATREGSAKRRVRWSWRGFTDQPVLTDQDGTFEVTELSAGNYVVRAYRKGGGDAVVEGVATGSDVELVIEATGVLAGQVVLAGGGVLDEFELTITDKKAGYNHNESFFRTGGQFTVTQVPAGSFEITVDASHGSAKAEASLEEGEAKKDLKLELKGKVTVRGTVVDLHTGEPVPGLRARVQATGGAFMLGGPDTGERKEITDAAGKFEVANVSTGDVRLSVMPKNWGGSDYDWTFRELVLPGEPEIQDLGQIRVVKKRVEDNKDAGDLGYTLKEWDPEADHGARKLEVAFIRPDGPAASTKLEAGDVITSIDGESVEGESVYLYYSLTRVPPGTKISIGTESGAKITILAAKPV
jgi:hypothetical protein